MSAVFNESSVEAAALSYFADMGYQTLHGPHIAPDELDAERLSYADVVLVGRLRDALARINPGVPQQALDEALDKAIRTESPSLVENNLRFHKLLVEGVEVDYRDADGNTAHEIVKLVDFDNPESNDWLALNQFTVIEGNHNRRPDVVVFVNGLPLAVMELKNPASPNATLKTAYNQIQTYKKQIPSLFTFNELAVISDGIQARAGTLTANWEWFMPWRTVEGDEPAPKETPELETVTRGVFEKRRFLDLIQYFIVFERGMDVPVKKMSAYHQFHAVNKAVASTIEASSVEGDRRAGVVWHTQGSGKSLSMTFYAGKVIRRPEMENPTLVVITDRNDLDDQLYGTFAACSDLLRQTPVQAQSREHLRSLLAVAAGGVVFTTVQKFFAGKGETHPLLSERRNVVVIADEAHRSQYDFIDGFARNLRDALPHASFIGFTGTPIELGDKNTKAVFGDYVDIYDIQQAVEDGATVPVYYEARVAKLELDKDEIPQIDPEFEEVTEGEESEYKEKLKSKWSRMEALVGSERRVNAVADDIVKHFEARREAMEGKGMIVCMSRRICVALYDAIVKLHPEWHDEDDAKGAVKVVMTGAASDPLEWQQHVRNKPGSEAIARRFKDPADPLKLVIVRDMWLTGFDAPPLHTMYIDKQMRGHGLMQAIARVNRVFRDKPGGLVVDYLGIAGQLQEALASYTKKDRTHAGVPQEKAVALMQEKYEIVKAMLHGFDYSGFFGGTDAERLSAATGAMNHVLEQEDGKRRFTRAMTQLSQAFALAVPHEDALSKQDEMRFFKTVNGYFAKTTSGGRTTEDLDVAIGQLVSNAVSSSEVLDLFSAAGLKSPDISILSDEFLEEVEKVPRKNLAVEMFNRLLKEQIAKRSRRNVVEAKSFAESLEESINRYNNQSIAAADVLNELIELAKQMREAYRRGEKMGLNDDELAFYDALGVNDSAVEVMGDEQLKVIARELVESVRKNISIDWSVRENARARMRVLVKRILRRYGYPPDMEESATQTVLRQAESFGDYLMPADSKKDNEALSASPGSPTPESLEDASGLADLERRLTRLGFDGELRVNVSHEQRSSRPELTLRESATANFAMMQMVEAAPQIAQMVDVIQVTVPYVAGKSLDLATDAALMKITLAAYDWWKNNKSLGDRIKVVFVGEKGDQIAQTEGDAEEAPELTNTLST